jgi:hypothetical protein
LAGAELSLATQLLADQNTSICRIALLRNAQVRGSIPRTSSIFFNDFRASTFLPVPTL